MAVSCGQRGKELVLRGKDTVVVNPTKGTRTHFPHGGPIFHICVQEAVTEGHHAACLSKPYASGRAATHPRVVVIKPIVVVVVTHEEVTWHGDGDGRGFVGEVEQVGHPDYLLRLIRWAPCMQPFLGSLQTVGTKCG